MMYKFGTTKRFDKALKLCKKRGYPIEELRKAIAILVENGCLPSKYKPHILHGNHEGEWEAHIISSDSSWHEIAPLQCSSRQA